FAFAPDETVLLSDAKQNWFWEPLQNILTADKYGPYHSFDRLRDFFLADHNTGIEVYEIGVRWTYLGSGYSPTVDCAANAIAYVDPSIEGILVWYPGNPIPIRYLYLDGIQEWEPEIYK